MIICSAQSSVDCEDFSSLASFRVVPERSCNAAAVHFCVVPGYHAEPSVPGPGPLFLSQLMIKAHPMMLSVHT